MKISKLMTSTLAILAVSTAMANAAAPKQFKVNVDVLDARHGFDEPPAITVNVNGVDYAADFNTKPTRVNADVDVTKGENLTVSVNGKNCPAVPLQNNGDNLESATFKLFDEECTLAKKPAPKYQD